MFTREYRGYTVEIETDNDAFQDGNCDYEIERILKKIADKIAQGQEPTTEMDINGNRVAKITY